MNIGFQFKYLTLLALLSRHFSSPFESIASSEFRAYTYIHPLLIGTLLYYVHREALFAHKCETPMDSQLLLLFCILLPTTCLSGRGNLILIQGSLSVATHIAPAPQWKRIAQFLLRSMTHCESFSCLSVCALRVRNPFLCGDRSVLTSRRGNRHKLDNTTASDVPTFKGDCAIVISWGYFWRIEC